MRRLRTTAGNGSRRTRWRRRRSRGIRPGPRTSSRWGSRPPPSAITSAPPTPSGRTAEADDLPEAWLDLAAEEALLGDEAAARDALDQAARLGLQRPALAMAIGDLAARLGEPDLSMTAFAAAVAANPSLAGDPWWNQDADRAARFPAIVDAAMDLTAPDGRWQIALMAGDPDRARALLPAVAYVAGTASPPDVIDAWEGDDAALARILAACDAHPLDAFALGWASRLESRRGNVEAAVRYLEWAFIGSSRGAGRGLEHAGQRPRPHRPDDRRQCRGLLGHLYLPAAHALESARPDA